MRCHLIISHAVWPDQAESAEVTAGLALPAFARLAGSGKREPFAPLSSRDWLGQCFGLDDFPAAPLTAAVACPDEEPGYWLRADPVHLAISQRGAELADPAGLALTEDEAGQLIETLNAQLSAEGWRFVAATPHNWLLRVPVKPEVMFTPLESVYGRNIHDFLPRGREAAAWHRLINEIQMLLHAHPVNDLRASAGRPLVNSLWPWGGGDYPLPEVLPRPAGTVHGSDPLLMALAGLAGARCLPAPRTFTELGGKDVWVVLDDLARPAQWRDAQAWRQAWLDIERNWFVQARKMLLRKKLRELHVTLPEAGVTVTVRRFDLLRLWRRAWLPWN